MANNKLVEDFRLKIKSIFKESADELDQRPDASGKPTMPPKPVGPLPDINEEDELVPDAGVAPEAGAEVAPPVEEEKVTLSVSLLSSLLNWAHGEEEAEEPQAGSEGAPEGLEAAPEAPLTEEDATVVPPIEGDEVAPEGDDALEDAGVEAIEIEALVTKIKELAQTKEILTDEDFGEIVAAAEVVEGEGAGEDLTGVMGDEGEAPAEPIQEEIGKIIPTGAKFKNEGNKGIGK
jgi:hypothetical protein